MRSDDLCGQGDYTVMDTARGKKASHEGSADSTWCVDDGQIGAELILDFYHNLLGPELLLLL